MAVALLFYPKFRAFTATGTPLVGGKLYSYTTGTDTPKDTYSDSAGSVANTNPVVLDAAGEATVYLNGQYKLVLKDADGVTKWTMDPVDGINTTSTSTTTNIRETALTASTDFATTPASTSTITMLVDKTANILPGASIRYVQSGTSYYAQVTAITSGLMTIRGAPLNTGVAISALYYDTGEVLEVLVTVLGTYEDTTDSTLLLTDAKMYFVWKKKKSYLVGYDAYSVTADSGATKGKVNIMLNGAAVGTDNSNAGLAISANATLYSSGVGISTSNYDVNYGELVDIKATAGTNGNATNLTVMMVFVTPITS